jgi:hypothetical protein
MRGTVITCVLLFAIGMLPAACIDDTGYYGPPVYAYGYPEYGWDGWGGWHHGWHHGHWDGNPSIAHAYAGHGFSGHGGLGGGHGGGGHGGGGHGGGGHR